MAETAVNAPAVSWSLFLEMSGLFFEADLACVATLFWADAVWKGRWDEDFEKCWRRRIWRKHASWK